MRHKRSVIHIARAAVVVLAFSAASTAQQASTIDQSKPLFAGLPNLNVGTGGDLTTPTVTNTGKRRIISYVLVFDTLLPNGQWEPQQTVNTSAVLHIRNGLTTEKVSIPPNESRVYPLRGFRLQA